MGGEKYLPCFNADGFVGSPPHGRGKGRCHHLVILVDGITPAWAGKRRQKRNCTHSNRDHPRVGGEKSMISTR